jgi:hypothetical protein
MQISRNSRSWLSIGILLLVSFPSLLKAQTDVRIVQNTIPHCDSANRWTPFTLDIVNNENDTAIVSFEPVQGTIVMPAEGAYNLADSIQLIKRNSVVLILPHPEQYKHLQDSDVLFFRLFYIVPPKSKISNVPMLFAFDRPETTQLFVQYLYNVGKYASSDFVTIEGIGGCPAGNWPFDTTALSNKINPGPFSWYPTIGGWTTGHGTADLAAKPPFPTKASYQIVGEFHEFFVPPVDSFYQWYQDYTSIIVRYLGAPKAIAHDTMLCTYTNCYGTVVVRVPITAYNIYRNVFTVSQNSVKLICPFMDRASTKIVVKNNINVPIKISNLHFVGTDAVNFSAPSSVTIPAKSSASIEITLFDNDKRKDLSYNTRAADLIGTVSQESASDVPCLDSVFKITIEGKIDVYCPDYASLSPELQHNTRPAGIIFPYFDNSFLTFYNNGDDVAHTFYPPYYEDSHFQISTVALLPEVISPALPLIQTETAYEDDAIHPTRQTRLIWPRDIDTIAIPVLVVGLDFQESVKENQDITILTFRPNPTRDNVFVHSESSLPISIVDELGRILEQKVIQPGVSLINLASYPQGVYRIVSGSISYTIVKVP